MFRKNIITKLTTGFLFIVIVSSLIVGIIAINIFKNNIFKIKEKNITSHANELAKALEPYMSDNAKSKEYTDLLKIISSVDNSKSWVINSTGEIKSIIDNEPTSIEDPQNFTDDYRHIITSALEGNSEKTQQYSNYYSQNMITVAVPIIDINKNVLGVILLHSSITDLTKSMDKFFIYLLIALLAEVVLAGLMGFYFSKNIAKPIKIVNDAALEMTKGNYKIKTNIYRKDEIGELSNSFDLLSSKLQYNIEQLSLEKNKLSDIIKSMNEGLISIDKDFKITNINTSALELLNVEVPKDSSLTLDILGIKKIVQTSLNESKKENIFSNYVDKTLNLSISTLLNNEKENTGAVIIIQDISQQEKLEKMRKDFIANVSHEFRTPLTILRGNLEALYDNVILQEEIPQHYLTLLQETKRLENMVKDLLDLSKFEYGNVDMHFENVDIKFYFRISLEY